MTSPAQGPKMGHPSIRRSAHSMDTRRGKQPQRIARSAGMCDMLVGKILLGRVRDAGSGAECICRGPCSLRKSCLSREHVRHIASLSRFSPSERIPSDGTGGPGHWRRVEISPLPTGDNTEPPHRYEPICSYRGCLILASTLVVTGQGSQEGSGAKTSL